MQLFDTIYVVSLPESSDRRTYIRDHLEAAGLPPFIWHDAYGPDHPEVLEVINSGKVLQYPPCFRCGKISCGKEDCNNTLIPQQVAVFITYLKLWQKIAASPQRALIFEDDVRLHSHFPKVLAALDGWIAQGKIDFRPTTPRLLRLGWALCADHELTDSMWMDENVKMSNPCHAMTSAFAQKAVEKFQTVYHTADVYLHQDLPEPGEAITIYPPIASELSWSVGRFQSLIRPREIHADYLDQCGEKGKAAEARDLARKHTANIAHRSVKSR